MATLYTYSFEQRLKKYRRQASNYCNLQPKGRWNALFLKGVLASLAPFAASAMLPNPLSAQCNPAFPQSFNLVSSSQNKLVEGGFDYNAYGSIPLDVNDDGNVDFVLNFSANSSGEDFLHQLTMLPYGNAGNGFIHEGDYVANIKRGASVPGAGPFVNLDVAEAKTLYKAQRSEGKETCEGFCNGEGNIGIVVNKSQYGFLNITLDIKSAQEANITINSGGVHPEAAKKISAKCAALPFKLPFFQANPNGTNILVAWTSKSVDEVHGLELQRSTDGEYFYKIDWKGQHDLKAGAKLLYEDKEAEKGIQYHYRIKQINTDGTFMYSTIASVALPSKQQNLSTAIGKIQADEHLRVAKLNVNAPKGGKATLVVLNNERVAVKTIASDLQVGENELVIPTNELPRDTYFVKIEVDGKRSYRKLDIR